MAQYGAIKVIRGGDTTFYMGFNVAVRPWMEKNSDVCVNGCAQRERWPVFPPKQALTSQTNKKSLALRFASVTLASVMVLPAS